MIKGQEKGVKGREENDEKDNGPPNAVRLNFAYDSSYLI